MRARTGLRLLALPLALLLVPAGSLADDAPDAAARLKALEERIESLEFDLDQVRKSSDDALFWLRLGDVAEIDVNTSPDGRTISMQPKVVDAGHHTRGRACSPDIRFVTRVSD